MPAGAEHNPFRPRRIECRPKLISVTVQHNHIVDAIRCAPSRAPLERVDHSFPASVTADDSTVALTEPPDCTGEQRRAGVPSWLSAYRPLRTGGNTAGTGRCSYDTDAREGWVLCLYLLLGIPQSVCPNGADERGRSGS